MPSFSTWLSAALICLAASPAPAAMPEPLVIQDHGSFIVGGTVVTAPGTFDPRKPLDPAGQTFHGDHAYAFYQVPVNARKYPVVTWHGAGQFSKSWETTVDGREGFQTIFLRRRFATYLIDQPRRGNAGRSTVEATVEPTADEQLRYDQFRIGPWPDCFPGSHSPCGDAEVMNRFFRSITPDTGPGWLTATRTAKAIIAFEPGSAFLFPQGEVPPAIPGAFDTVEGTGVLLEGFMAPARIPILVLYGDNIPDKPMDLPAQDSLRARLETARLWRDTVNRHGGNVTLVHLPEVGIHGNTHVLMSDRNNARIVDLVSKFLADKGLD